MPDGVTPRLSVAWFTPMSTRSAIGEFSCHVASELAKIADVEIWTSDDPPHHPVELSVIRYSRESDDLERLNERDVIVYNMGDYLPFHGDMHAVARRYPGVVILHDRVLHHLYAGMWLTVEPASREMYVERMHAYYGRLGEQVARASLEGRRLPVWESDAEALLYPLFEEGIRGAHGVVTHSEVQARDIRARWLGPVRALHLPCYGDVLRRAAGRPLEQPDGRVHLLTVGHLNPNKQVDRVVEMLAASPEMARSVHYTVVGPDDGFTRYVRDLRHLADRHAERLTVEILGWQPEAELDRLMAQADVFVNLRHPVMEGSSASLMRQLAYGRPILCFDSGFFGELPDGTVARVEAGDFVAAADVLRELVGSPHVRQAMGERARELAASYSERSYVEGLMELIEESRSAAPGLDLLDSVAHILGEMSVDEVVPIFDEIANDFARVLSL
jgi:glycosyltransferase involved in cell wall biosynthesis